MLISGPFMRWQRLTIHPTLSVFTFGFAVAVRKSHVVVTAPVISAPGSEFPFIPEAQQHDFARAVAAVGAAHTVTGGAGGHGRNDELTFTVVNLAFAGWAGGRRRRRLRG